ncbi:Na+/H+ antiporter subunit E [Desulfobulbus sp.]|uniref:Na+/H+ antiporter subunit E n=1 Tax=Desulfobulbus sp. TaxID=895 RepID=UPI0027B912C7|nr:Na+/H+ antiporter subunit E [Desulfobulbus sp.]
MKRWLPQPLTSGCLWLVWLLLAQSLTPGHLLLGGLLALVLPLFTVRFWPDRPRVRRPLLLLPYLAVLLWDITLANLVAARLILGPARRLRPAFIRLPLDLRSELAIVLLTHTISLTPGTVAAHLSPDQRVLLIHALDVDDEAALIARIKQRYEQPLKEIFAC